VLKGKYGKPLALHTLHDAPGWEHGAGYLVVPLYGGYFSDASLRWEALLGLGRFTHMGATYQDTSRCSLLQPLEAFHSYGRYLSGYLSWIAAERA
jgi:hypothetical protein